MTTATINSIPSHTTGSEYIESLNVAISASHGTTTVTKLDNAMKRGKTCRSYHVSHEHDPLAVVNGFDSIESMIAIFDAMADSRDSEDERVMIAEIDGSPCRVFVRDEKANRVFSPWAKVNPLKKRPKKWTLSHVIRGLMNGEISVSNRMTLTDDYAFDAATKFGKGDLDAIEFAKELTESPSGWRVYPDSDGTININCHTFRYVTGTVKID